MDKQLIGMPWRVALALQADGWWLRQDIIWSKPNPMPESATDRCVKSHEYLFILTKLPRYYFDHDAIKEAAAYAGQNRGGSVNRYEQNNFGGDCKRYDLRNKRSVWSIIPSHFPGAHFATFPPALVEPCIKAGSSEKGCCASCGAPIRRVVEATGGTIGEAWHDHSDDLGLGQQKDADGMESYSRTTTGWEPTCTCEDAGEPVPCKVLDPFGGAGTAALVADRLGRDAVLVELNKEYAEMARDRILADCPMFSSVELLEGIQKKAKKGKKGC